MAISDKLNYLIETKSQLKDMINYGLPTENQITNETTFRNYVSSIFEAFLESLRDSTTLYTNLPKISGNGTQITLNDTANAPMRITLKASQLTQDGTPTPDSPQDIHTISGSNSIVVEGKNLAYTGWASDFVNRVNNTNSAKLETYDGKNCLVFKPSVAADEDIYMFKPIGGFKENTRYTFKIDKYSIGAFGDMDIVYTDGSVTEVARQTLTPNSWNNIVQTSSANKTIKYLKPRWRSNAWQYIDLDTFMVYEGTEDTTYEPYVSQTAPINLGNIEYCKIGDYEDKFILTSGKNLFDKNNITTGKTYSPTGEIVTLASAFIQETYIPVLSSTQYTISTTNSYVSTTDYRLVICEYDENKNFIQRTLEFQAKSKTITTTANTKYVRLCASNVTLNELQFEKGTATDYEPYGTNQWYIKKNIGKVVLDGSESGAIGTNSKGIKYFYKSIADKINGGTILSNNFSQVSSLWTLDAYTDCMTAEGSNKIVAIMTSDSTITTLEQFKTWFSTHNTEIWYQLATPTYTKITGTLETQLENIYKNMLSYKGTTNVSQVNNDLPFVLGVSAIEDLE